MSYGTVLADGYYRGGLYAGRRDFPVGQRGARLTERRPAAYPSGRRIIPFKVADPRLILIRDEAVARSDQRRRFACLFHGGLLG
jgi:hypothetical protein